MTKQSFALIAALSAALLSANALFAQQAPADNSQKPAASSPAAKPATAAKPSGSQTGAAKSGTTKPGTTARKPALPAPLKTAKEKASYAIGMNIGNGLKKEGADIDAAVLARGLKDAMAGTKPAITDEEAKAALTAMATELRAKQQAKIEAEGIANKKAGDDFLAANKAKDGVVALPSGLQYKILKEGTGPKPAATDQVSCSYRGTLVDGTEFDSSAKHGGQPVTFPVTGVIKGWTEALQLMPVGSKWQLFVPPDLAYGDRSAGPDIGPKSTLIFEVELVSIAPKPEAAKPAGPSATKPAAPEEKPEAKPEARPNNR